MSEESGNIGWGIPEAFAECLAASPELAKTYHKILISYIVDLGFDDNYCDNDQLRVHATGQLGDWPGRGRNWPRARANGC